MFQILNDLIKCKHMYFIFYRKLLSEVKNQLFFISVPLPERHVFRFVYFA